jgi:hypothetical protein
MKRSISIEQKGHGDSAYSERRDSPEHPPPSRAFPIPRELIEEPHHGLQSSNRDTCVVGVTDTSTNECRLRSAGARPRS